MRGFARVATRLAADFSTARELLRKARCARAGPRGYPFKHAVPPTSAGSSSHWRPTSPSCRTCYERFSLLARFAALRNAPQVGRDPLPPPGFMEKKKKRKEKKT